VLSDVAAALGTAKGTPASEPAAPQSNSEDHTEPRVLAVPLSPAVYEALYSVARRNDVPASKLVSELLETWLKYR
jgi:serine/threonine-protein kinase